MDATWTLSELVAEVAARIAQLPAPANGQVRAVPDERTVRYYGTIGLLARPAAMRGRTALYDRRHLAQVVAIKRLQATGKSLAEIAALWPELDDATLQRMSGIELSRRSATPAFWKHAPATPSPSPSPSPTPTPSPTSSSSSTSAELAVALAPNVSLRIALPEGASVTAADLRALRAAAHTLVTELANRRLTLEDPQ